MSTNVNKRYVFRSWKRGCGLPPKGFMVLFIFGFLVVVASSSQVIAANHYIRDGGNGNGTDWNNAWDDLPSSLTRGDTYYVADGTYGAYQFNDAASGSLYNYQKSHRI